MPIDPQIKILLVEDSKITRKMEFKALKDVGFDNVLQAGDGDEAIEILQSEEDIRLIISDWNMPGKDGYELLVWVRSEEKHKDIPFIMATARGEKKQMAKAEEVGVSNFITKPFSPPELKSVIEDTLGEKKEEKALKAPPPPRKSASGKVLLNVAHIQITDHLTLGVLKHMIATEKFQPRYFELQTQCMPGWNPVQKALENGDVNAAFILAPIAMDLFGADAPIKLTLFAHKNGSICVRNKKGMRQAESLRDYFKGKTFYIPHTLSIHHMLANMFFRELGLSPGMASKEEIDVLFEVVPPIKMPEFLAKSQEVCGFMVAEPLGTKAISAGSGSLMFLSGGLWQYHPCCVVAMRDDFIQAHEDAVYEFTSMLVQAGQFIEEKPEIAAEIGVEFLDPNKTIGLNTPVLKNVLREPLGIKTNDLFPVIEDLERIQRYMANTMEIGSLIDLEKFVDIRFAENACEKAGSVRLPSEMKNVSQIVTHIQSSRALEQESKTMLDKEGKYLIFAMGEQEYGIGILWIREIIGVMPIKTIPQTPDYIKGVINLRGNVIPVIDLRLRFSMKAKEYNERTCIIILDVASEERGKQVGMIVDSVSEVMDIKAGDIEEPPTMGLHINTNYILAMAKTESGVKILFDTNRLFSGQDKEILELSL